MKCFSLIFTIAAPNFLSTVQAMPAPGSAQLSRRGTGYFTAFDDDACSLNGGDRAQFGNSLKCIPTANRHSFLIEGCTAGVLVFADTTTCDDDEPAGTYQNVYDGQCINVNTGTNWQSAYVECKD